jgi:hypothetical protein
VAGIICRALMAGKPRLGVRGSTAAGVKVGAATLKPFSIGASVYTQDTDGSEGTFFAGIVTGSVEAEVGGADGGGIAAEASFAFDTRGGGSWEVAAKMSYTSENLNATLQLASASECRESGTAGTGSLEIAFGEGKASLVGRCRLPPVESRVESACFQLLKTII